MLKVISLLLIALGATSAAFEPIEDSAYQKYIDVGSKIGNSHIKTQYDYKKKYFEEDIDDDDDDDGEIEEVSLYSHAVSMLSVGGVNSTFFNEIL